MNPSTELSSELSFMEFLRKPANRKSALSALGISVGLFIVFKLLYPYPDFFSDSYSYLFAAYANLHINIWPIGYSKFLRWFHFITYSDTAFERTQYLLVQLAALYFFFTINYFYKVSKFTRQILFFFLFINPLTLYLCNTINSDALFGALSIAWFTQLLWIVRRPRLWMIFSQAVLLFCCFTIRNNAYYYPLVAAVAFSMSRQNGWYKLSGIVMPILFLVPFIIYTQNKAYQLTGTRQFSLFTGWQLANNALYIYDQVSVDSSDIPTQQAKELNRISVEFFKHVRKEEYRDALESYVGNFFIRQPESPLKVYYSTHYKLKTEIDGEAKWGKASADMEPFGKYIIIHNPFAYFKFFMLPNTLHYFIPPLSHLERYNYGDDSIDIIGKIWFRYPSTRIRVFSHRFQGCLIIYTALFLVFNLYYLWYLISYLLKKGFKQKGNDGQATFLLTAFLLVLNFGFSVFATVNILRYQFVSMIVLLSFSLLMSDFLDKLGTQKKTEQKTFIPDPEKSILLSNS